LQRDLVVRNIKWYKIITNTNPSLLSYNAYWDLFSEDCFTSFDLSLSVCKERLADDVSEGKTVDRGDRECVFVP